MSNLRRQRLEKQRDGLQTEWELQQEKLQTLRSAHAIEAGTAVKFQLGKQIEAQEKVLAQLESKLERLELELAAGSTRQELEFEWVTIAAGQAEDWSLQRSSGRVESRSEDLGNGLFLEMVFVPAGQFTMGSPPEELGRELYQSWEQRRQSGEDPRHQVTVPSFWLGKYPVTQAQWRAIAALPKIDRWLEPNPSYFEGDQLPVEQVSWLDGVEFCQRLSQLTGRNYRLPSEAEWEYACRAGSDTPFHWGMTMTTDLANYCGVDREIRGSFYSGAYGRGPQGVYREKTTPVGSFPPNRFGLYDMHGNVWEWCGDSWHATYRGAPIDGSCWVGGGEEPMRVLRGGSWMNLPWVCRSAYRLKFAMHAAYLDTGLRVVCSD